MKKVILNDGEVICKECEGKGKLYQVDCSYRTCEKCNGDGKVDWVTHAMGPGLNSPIVDVLQTNGTLTIPPPSSDLTFWIHDKEMIKLSEDGFYIEGRKVSDDKSIYEGFKKFLQSAGFNV